MKNLSLSLMMLCLGGGAMAQSAPSFSLPVEVTPRTPASFPQKQHATTALNTFFIDYDSAEAGYWASQYVRYIWDFNYNYTPNDNALQYFVIAFDSLYDSYNQVGYPRSTVTTIQCDSIYMVLGQENNSGMDDSIIVKLIDVNAFGYPAANVLWSDTVIIPASSPLSSDWLQPVLLSMPCGYTVTTNDRFALRVEYHGSTLDTAGWLAGFGDNGACGSNPVSAIMSQYSPWQINTSTWYTGNTFALWTQYTAYGILPTSGGANLYYDCNSNSTYDPGTDGENFLQNISVYVKVTSDPLTTVEDPGTGARLFANRPNPFTGSTTVSYELGSASDILLTVYDVTGTSVMKINEGMKAPGKHELLLDASALQAGIYFYTLEINGTPLTGKMTLVK